jgi:integrase
LNEEKKLIKGLTAKIAKREGNETEWSVVVSRWEQMVIDDGHRILSPVTLKDGLSTLRRWTENWLQRPAAQINRADGREVFRLMEAAGKSQSVQRRVRHLVRTIYSWGIEERLINGVSETPVVGIQIKKDKAEAAPEILNIDQIRKLLFEAKRLEHPWYPIWCSALLTGMRNGELHAWEFADVDLENRKITVSKSYNTRMMAVKSTKAGYWRTVPISDELHGLLIELKKIGRNAKACSSEILGMG